MSMVAVPVGDDVDQLRALLALAISKLSGELDVNDDDRVGVRTHPVLLSQRNPDTGRTRVWVQGTD